MTAAQTIDFGQDNNSNALISRIFINGISTDFFDRTIGDIQVLENGRVAAHGQMHQNTAVYVVKANIHQDNTDYVSN